MKNIKVHNLIIVDASGSMSSIYKEALSGINETLSTIRLSRNSANEVEQYVTLLSFSGGNENLQYVYKSEPIEQVVEVRSSDYQLRGATALYDAIGSSVSVLRNQVAPGDRVLVTIITDGYENDSRQWSGTQVHELVEELKRQDWVFTYIGANQDVAHEAGKIGIRNTMRFEATHEGTRAMFERERHARMQWNERVRRNEVEEEGCYFSEVLPSRLTPKRIGHLEEDEVFVFGSNVLGEHSGGSSLMALRHFGAELGVGEGLRGQSYAIPTVGLSYSSMAGSVNAFLHFAALHTELRFLVTRIGCGSAGYSDHEMARLFAPAKNFSNVALPEEWWAWINSH